ncbi:arginase family protein [Leifsonia poae]|uniref:arginase family protein n=1 Tax=Leifsonia poae TaxID=110933 RepID=UPI001CBD2163|nr:arginase family protein [Leifsonia poae]
MTGAAFLVVPQWQGSGSSRAMRLIDGAEAIRGDLPASATTTVAIPASAGDSLGTGVHRFSALATVRDAVLAELTVLDEPVITIGGDCGADLASIQHVVAGREPGSVALVWFDAHADLNDVASSPSGAFHGMVARALLGEGPEQLASTGAAVLTPAQLVLAGTRSLDDGESEYIESNGVRLLAADTFADPAELVAAVESTGASAVYLHIDLDVLDPATIDGVGSPEPFGVQPELLVAAVRALRSRFEFAGAGITEFAPESVEAAEQDMPVILRILGSLTAPLTAPEGSSPTGSARHLSSDPRATDDAL